MKDNYCIMNVDEHMWEMCIKSESGDVIYPTKLFIDAKNLDEAIQIAKEHIDINKEVCGLFGGTIYYEGVVIK